MAFVNLTPHKINIVDDNGNTIESFDPDGRVARAKMKSQIKGLKMNGIPIVKEEFLCIENLPDLSNNENTYIVSRMVKAYVPDRPDVVYPTDFIRDDNGRITGAKALAF